MAEFAQKNLEQMRPILEQIKVSKLFTESEIRNVTKKWKACEYQIQRHQKSKEDYLRYIQYQMNLMQLVKQRRKKFGITRKKSDIDFAIANKINHLYKDATERFKDDLRFYFAYITFCKHMKFTNNVSKIIERMLANHSKQPKCWHVAARWEIEETNDIEKAKYILFRGLFFNPDSQLLYTDMFRLELDEALVRNKKSEAEKEYEASNNVQNSEVPSELRFVFELYKDAIKKVKDIKFIINLLNITQEYENTEKLQVKIVSDIIKEYSHEPLMWDTMARRELLGLVMPLPENKDNSMKIDNSEPTSLRDRITNCYEVYQTAVKKIKTKEMWSLFVDCMLEINEDLTTLPNFKRKLLKNVLLQGHQAKKLQEKCYLNWIDMLNTNDQNQEGDNVNSKLYEVLCWATDALPESESLWRAKLEYFLNTHQEDLAVETFNKAVGILEKNSLSLWKLRLLHLQVNHPEKLEQFFREGLQKISEESICNFLKPHYIEWLAVSKDIDAARQVYNELSLLLPPCLELHKKMAALELTQPDISLQLTRKVYNNMTLCFGKHNIRIWLEYIVFEMKHGEAEKAPIIYERAVKTLKSGFTNKFITEHSLIKANPDLLDTYL